MDRPLEIEGQFLLEFDGGHARIEIRDETVEIALPDGPAALAMARQVPRPARRAALRRADAAMRGAGLVGVVRIGGRAVARIGEKAEPGPLARLLGVDPLALSLFSLLGAVLGRRGRPAEGRDAPAPSGPGGAPGPGG